MNSLKKLNKFLAGLVAVTFFTANTLTPSPLAFASVEPANTSRFTDFKIPSEYGKVADFTPALFSRDIFHDSSFHNRQKDDSRILIHIQEAHANYDAQNNIRNLLDYLAQNYEARLIFLEGSGDKLQPERLNFFPDDPELQKTVTERLMKAGELTGAEAFLIEKAGDTNVQPLALTVPRPEGWGVESAEAYRNNWELYKSVYQKREMANQFLEDFYLQWRKRASRGFDKNSRDFLLRYAEYEETKISLEAWLETLRAAAESHLFLTVPVAEQQTLETRETIDSSSIAMNMPLDLTDVRAQIDWPALVRYFRLKKVGKEIDEVKVEIEKATFLNNISAGNGSSGVPRSPSSSVALKVVDEVEAIFNSAKTGNLPVHKTRFVFERLMDVLPEDFSFDAYPNLRLHIQQMILMSEIDSRMLQSEMKELVKRILESLLKTDQEKELVTELREYQLLKKLFHLELSRDEYEQEVRRNLTPEKLARLSGAARGANEKEVMPVQNSALSALFAEAIQFYDGAIYREDKMMENAGKILGSRKDKVAVLITGGFHTDGFKKQITESGHSYIGITPSIGSVAREEEKNYLRALLGTGGERVTEKANGQHSSVNVLPSYIAALLAGNPDFMRQTLGYDYAGQRFTRIKSLVREVILPLRPGESEALSARLNQAIQNLFTPAKMAGARSEVRDEAKNLKDQFEDRIQKHQKFIEQKINLFQRDPDTSKKYVRSNMENFQAGFFEIVSFLRKSLRVIRDFEPQVKRIYEMTLDWLEAMPEDFWSHEAAPGVAENTAKAVGILATALRYLDEYASAITLLNTFIRKTNIQNDVFFLYHLMMAHSSFATRLYAEKRTWDSRAEHLESLKYFALFLPLAEINNSLVKMLQTVNGTTLPAVFAIGRKDLLRAQEVIRVLQSLNEAVQEFLSRPSQLEGPIKKSLDKIQISVNKYLASEKKKSKEIPTGPKAIQKKPAAVIETVTLDVPQRREDKKSRWEEEEKRRKGEALGARRAQEFRTEDKADQQRQALEKMKEDFLGLLEMGSEDRELSKPDLQDGITSLEKLLGHKAVETLSDFLWKVDETTKKEQVDQSINTALAQSSRSEVRASASEGSIEQKTEASVLPPVAIRDIKTWAQAFKLIRWIGNQPDMTLNLSLIRQLSLYLREKKKELKLNTTRDYDQYPDDLAFDGRNAMLPLIRKAPKELSRSIKELALALPYAFSDTTLDSRSTLWGIAEDLDDRTLRTKFAKDLRETLHGPTFSYHVLPRVRKYIHFLETGDRSDGHFPAAGETPMLLQERDIAIQSHLSRLTLSERSRLMGERELLEQQDSGIRDAVKIYRDIKELETALEILFEAAAKPGTFKFWLDEGFVKNELLLKAALQEIVESFKDLPFQRITKLINARVVVTERLNKTVDPGVKFSLYHLDRSIGQVMNLSLGTFLEERNGEPAWEMGDALALIRDLSVELFESGFITRYTAQWSDLLDDSDLSFSQLRDVLGVIEKGTQTEFAKWAKDYHHDGEKLYGPEHKRLDQAIALLRKEKFATTAAMALLKAVKDRIAQELPAPEGKAVRSGSVEKKQGWLFDKITHIDNFKDSNQSWGRERKVFGGKGSYLIRMHSLGLPVPSGFILPSSMGKEPDLFVGKKKLFEDDVLRNLRILEESWSRKMGRPFRYGVAPRNPSNPDFEPLFLSVRSGSAFIMPGISETAVAIGFSPEIYEYTLKTRGGQAGHKAFISFIESIGVSLGISREKFENVIQKHLSDTRDLGLSYVDERTLAQIVADMTDILKDSKVFDQFNELYKNPELQLFSLIPNIFQSWNSPKAKRYRQEKGLSDDWNTPVIVQAYVFGDRDEQSGSGTALSHERTGEMAFSGEWVPMAEGMVHMQGRDTTLPLAELEKKDPASYRILKDGTTLLARHMGVPQMVEFTIEGGKPWFLQTVYDQRVGNTESFPDLDYEVMRRSSRVGGGNVAYGNSGGLSGVVVFSPSDILRDDILKKAADYDAVILVSAFPTSDDSPDVINANRQLKKLSAKRLIMLTQKGGLTSHAAVVANYEKIPTVVDVQGLSQVLEKSAVLGGQPLLEGDVVTVDFGKGGIYRGRIPQRSEARQAPGEGQMIWPFQSVMHIAWEMAPFMKKGGQPAINFGMALGATVGGSLAGTNKRSEVRNVPSENIGQWFYQHLDKATVIDVGHDRVQAYLLPGEKGEQLLLLRNTGYSDAADINFIPHPLLQKVDEVSNSNAVFEFVEIFDDADLSVSRTAPGDRMIFTDDAIRHLGLGTRSPLLPGHTKVYSFRKISDKRLDRSQKDYQGLLKDSIQRYRRFGAQDRFYHSFVTKEIERALKAGYRDFKTLFHQLSETIRSKNNGLDIGNLSSVFGDIVIYQPALKEILHAFLVNMAVEDQQAEAHASEDAIKILRSATIGEVVITSPETLWTEGTGGLAKAVSENAMGLAALGINVTVVAPIFAYNKDVVLKKYQFRDTGRTVVVPYDTGGYIEKIPIKIYKTKIKGVRVLGLASDRIFPKLKGADWEESGYNGSNSFKLRFARALSLGTLLAIREVNIHARIIQTNDWPTGYIKAFLEGRDRIDPELQKLNQDPHLSHAKVISIFHNLHRDYQGWVYITSDWKRRDLSGEEESRRNSMVYHDLGMSIETDWEILFDPGSPGIINPTYTSFKTSDYAVTVSHGYHHRSMDPSYWDEFGGLTGLFKWKHSLGEYVSSPNGLELVEQQRAFLRYWLRDAEVLANIQKDLSNAAGKLEPNEFRKYLEHVVADPERHMKSFMEIGHEAERRMLAQVVFDYIHPVVHRKLAEKVGFRGNPDDLFIYSMLHRVGMQKGHHLLVAEIWRKGDDHGLQLNPHHWNFKVSGNMNELSVPMRNLFEDPDYRVQLTDDQSARLNAFADAKGVGVLRAQDVLMALFPDVRFVIAGSTDEGSGYYEGFSSSRDLSDGQLYFNPTFVKPGTELYELIYGGSDLFGMPSTFEPGGLSNGEAAGNGVVRHLRDADGLSDKLVRSGELSEGFKVFNPVHWLSSAIKLYEIRQKNPELWREVQYQLITQDSRWLPISRDFYTEAYRKRLGEPPIPALSALEVASAIHRAREQKNPADELMTAGYTAKAAVDPIVDALVKSDSELLVRVLLAQHIRSLAKIDRETEVYLEEQLNEALIAERKKEVKNPQIQLRLEQALSILETGDHTPVRSEVRSWAADNAPELTGFTVVSRQLEAGLSRDILDKLIQHYGKKVAGLVAATTVTGGLGALMHDLFPSWQKNFGELTDDDWGRLVEEFGKRISAEEAKRKQIDAFAVNVIYDEIKGQQFALDVPEEVQKGQKTLGDYLREVLTEEPDFRFDVLLEPGNNFRSKAVEWIGRTGDELYRKRLQQAREAVEHAIKVKVYPTRTSVGGMPNFYVEAFYISADGTKVQIFDEVYPDAPHGSPNLWRDLQMAVYGKVTELLALKLQEKGVVKKDILFVDNEVFVSIPTPLLPNAIHHHINHSVFAPTIYHPDEASLELLGYPKTLARYIVHDGRISIVDAVGATYDLVTGVALYEHTPAVAGGVMPGYSNAVDSYNENGLRSTNGVLIEQWQSPLLRGLTDQYKKKLGMIPTADDRDFFAVLQSPENEATLETFKERTDMIKAYLTGRLMLWLKESQNRPAWFDKTLRAYQKEFGLKAAQGSDVIHDLHERLQKALQDEAEWDSLFNDPKVQMLRREFLSRAIVSNVRRQVSYKGPDKWLEILRILKGDPKKLAWYKEHAARAVIGGREFGSDAHELFLEIQGLIRELKLEDLFATIENYNIEVAPVIFQGVSGTVMITYEVLEASATSMMKALPNAGALVGAWGGSEPELFTIVNKSTREEVDIFKEKITYEQLIEKLHAGEWEITNGFLVEYSPERDGKFILYTLRDGKIEKVNARSPDANSMMAALAGLQGKYRELSTRKELEWESLKSSPLVDMEKSQARAHMKLWQRVIQGKEAEKKLFAKSHLSPERALAFFSNRDHDEGFIWRKEPLAPLEIASSGVLSFLESARQVRTHGADAYQAVAYHAEKGEIFKKIFSYLDGFKEDIPEFHARMKQLEAEARETPDLFERVKTNFVALRLLDRFAEQLSGKILEGYITSRSAVYEPLLQDSLFRQTLYFYLESSGQRFGSLNKGLAGFGIELGGEKYLAALNINETKYPGVDGGEPKAWGQFYGQNAFQWLTGQTDPGSLMTFQVVDAIHGDIYGMGEDKKPYPFWILAEGVFPIGIPAPDIQILQFQAVGEMEQYERKAQEGSLILDDLQALVEGNAGEQLRQQKPRSDWLKKNIGALLHSDPEELRTRMKAVSTIGKEKAVTIFGAEGVRPVMAFITALIPDLLEDMKDWDPEVYRALSRIVNEPSVKELFEKGEVSFSDSSRDTAIVVTRTLPSSENDPSQQRHIVMPIHFSKFPYNKEEGKVWFGIGSISNLGLTPGIVYKTRDWILQVTYEKEHTLAALLKNGWRVGISVVRRKDPAGIQQSGWRFQVLEMVPVGISRSEAREAFAEAGRMITTKQLRLPEWVGEYAKTIQNRVFTTPEERMTVAVELSRRNVENETGGPFGAVVFDRKSGKIFSMGVNLVVPERASFAHAEMVALTLAQERLKNFSLDHDGREFELVTSSQPCAMCFGAIPWSGVKGVVMGARGSDVETITGFDEGPIHPEWFQELSRRGMVVGRDVLRSEAIEVLRAYVQEKGTIYNGKAESESSARSESRAYSDLRFQQIPEMNYEEFLVWYETQSKASRSAMEKLTVKIMQGIAPLLANRFEVIEKMASKFILSSEPIQSLREKIEADRFEVARRILGVKTIEGYDALVLTKELALDRKGLFAIQKVFGGMPVIVLADESSLSASDRSFLSRIPEASRPVFLSAGLLKNPGDLPEAVSKVLGRKSNGRMMSLKAMAGTTDAMATLLKQQLKDEVVLLTTSMFENFLSVAGVGGLVEKMQAEYFAIARSA